MKGSLLKTRQIDVFHRFSNGIEMRFAKHQINIFGCDKCGLRTVCNQNVKIFALHCVFAREECKTRKDKIGGYAYEKQEFE